LHLPGRDFKVHSLMLPEAFGADVRRVS
jgi:hypothetical protein